MEKEFIRMIDKISKSGYAGVLSNGNITDRRINPDATPIQANFALDIPKPKIVTDDDILDMATNEGLEFSNRLYELNKDRLLNPPNQMSEEKKDCIHPYYELKDLGHSILCLGCSKSWIKNGKQPTPTIGLLTKKHKQEVSFDLEKEEGKHVFRQEGKELPNQMNELNKLAEDSCKEVPWQVQDIAEEQYIKGYEKGQEERVGLDKKWESLEGSKLDVKLKTWSEVYDYKKGQEEGKHVFRQEGKEQPNQMSEVNKLAEIEYPTKYPVTTAKQDWTNDANIQKRIGFVKGHQKAQDKTKDILNNALKATETGIKLIDSINKWESVDEPPKNGSYLVYNLYSERVETSDYKNGNWISEIAGESVNYNDIISHYMVLPQPPKQ